ncbi:hypothetical protein EYR36_001869 [Pleurotus pulmonarius]|nr:hypothetical protein EYR36_001869 [Pleurotus pulmonarius]KAF4588375.1 hypothetical protein EYR38_010343 [Pleurotus pulmonarius]
MIVPNSLSNVQMVTFVPQEIPNSNSLKAKTPSVNVVRAKASNGEENGAGKLVVIDAPGAENDILLDQPAFVGVGENTKAVTTSPEPSGKGARNANQALGVGIGVGAPGKRSGPSRTAHLEAVLPKGTRGRGPMARDDGGG